MNSSTWICCYFMPLLMFILLAIRNKNRKKKVRQHIVNKKGLLDSMNEVIEKFMNKGVRVTTIDEADIGRLISFNDGWITITNRGADKCINTEYIVKIEEYKLPEDKKKKKTNKSNT